MLKLDIITNNGRLPVSLGKYNLDDYCNELVLYPNSRVQIFEKKENLGKNIIISNSENKNKKINLKKVIDSTLIDNIGSIYVFDSLCNVEGFNDVKDSCHYICSQVNFQNILIVLLILIVIVIPN